jgi:hypothetical protein
MSLASPRPALPKNAQSNQTNRNVNKKQPRESTKSRKQNKIKWVLVKAKRSTQVRKCFKNQEGGRRR